MKKIFSFQAVLFCSLFFLSWVVYSDVSKTLYTGLSFTHNLEVQAGTDINTDSQDSQNRQGFAVGVSFIKQSLDYTGGYTLQADAFFNQGLSGDEDNNISTLLLSASKLSALNPDWLLRNRISLNQYDNEALASNSYNGLLLETTLGYLDKAGGGNDISFALKREQHHQIDQEAYDTTRSSLRLIHYFSHEKNSPYWSLNTEFKNNNASDNLRDYDSVRLGVNYQQWSLASFKGQLGFNWQYDRYDQPIRVSPRGTVIPINRIPNDNRGINRSGMGITTREKERRDHLYDLSLQLGKPLTSSITLQFSANVGVYDSTINADSEDFYRLATQLNWAF